MKLGQNVIQPSLFESKEKYSGYFDLKVKIPPYNQIHNKNY